MHADVLTIVNFLGRQNLNQIIKGIKIQTSSKPGSRAGVQPNENAPPLDTTFKDLDEFDPVFQRGQRQLMHKHILKEMMIHPTITAKDLLEFKLASQANVAILQECSKYTMDDFEKEFRDEDPRKVQADAEQIRLMELREKLKQNSKYQISERLWKNNTTPDTLERIDLYKKKTSIKYLGKDETTFMGDLKNKISDRFAALQRGYERSYQVERQRDKDLALLSGKQDKAQTIDTSK